MARTSRSIGVIEVRQWLKEWDHISFNAAAFQSKPPQSFYMFSLRAADLKALTGVYRRSTKSGLPRAMDQNVQRGHEEERSGVIREFVKHGYPWCDMSEAKRKAPGANDLLKPGWLPTAILVNVLQKGDSRNGTKLTSNDSISIQTKDGQTSLVLPPTFKDAKWTPESIFPMEVIDGQHRLWAFEGFDPGDDYELPVVAFNGLDRSWQAYLFWSVNITPKKINRSLAFDLYPLLRQEDWLDRFTGHSIYRESRAQELVEALWGNPVSPWHKRINMLGETTAQRESRLPMVTQAAWVRSLMASFVKQWEGSGTRIGGLFGAPLGGDRSALPWNRPMQAAFLIFAAQKLRDAVSKGKSRWAVHLRSQADKELSAAKLDAAFYGANSLLTTDQGIRGFLSVVNDLCYVAADDLELSEWTSEQSGRSKSKTPSATEDHVVENALKTLSGTKADSFLEEVAVGLATYDWRTSSTPGLSEEERLHQSVFRGSSGYKELRKDLVSHLTGRRGDVGRAAKDVANILGYV